MTFEELEPDWKSVYVRLLVLVPFKLPKHFLRNGYSILHCNYCILAMITCLSAPLHEIRIVTTWHVSFVSVAATNEINGESNTPVQIPD